MGAFSGVELDKVVLSVATAHRVRTNHCQEVADGTLTRFTEQAKESGAPLVVHFDGEKGLLQVYRVTFHFKVSTSPLILAAGRR